MTAHAPGARRDAYKSPETHYPRCNDRCDGSEHYLGTSATRLTDAEAAVARVRALFDVPVPYCNTGCPHLECKTARAVLAALDGVEA